MREGVRRVGSFVLVLAAHAAAVGAALGWRAAEPPYSPPPAAVMLELAPLPAAPETPQIDAPPAPELREAVPEPQEPPPVDLKPMKIELAEAEPPPPVEITPPDKIEIVLPQPEPPPPVELKPPPPKPRPVEKRKPPQERKPPSDAAAPQATPDQAQRATAPTQGATPEPPSAGLPTWRNLVSRHLERHKRYPPDAQRQRQEGVVYVHFTLSRDGRVLAARIATPTGVASLDQEGLDLLQRAQPLPPFPPDQPGEAMELVVPIQFFMKR
jgi:protein TonB